MGISAGFCPFKGNNPKDNETMQIAEKVILKNIKEYRVTFRIKDRPEYTRKPFLG
jgi:hypothetical protein